MKLVDVHCHLESSLYEGKLDAIIADARRAGLAKLITASITPGEWELSRSLAERYPEVEFALGVHPWYIREGDFAAMDTLPEAAMRGAVAIGEAGLDKKVERPAFDIQLRIFTQQVIIARELNLPLVIHCRGAYYELLACLRQAGLPEAGGLVHSFSGSVEIAEELMAEGLSFSMGGVLTYRNSRKRSEVLKRIYPDRFMLETDSPDIPPVEARGVLHVPANIVYNLRAASEILGVSEEKIAELTTENAFRMFKLGV